MDVASFLDDEEIRLLTAEAFDFMFKNELKRAMRSQNFLTLLAIDARPQDPAGERKLLAREVARLISPQVRESDLLSRDDDGRLSLILFDANLQNSLTVVDRLMSRFEQYKFSAPTDISVGIACCPTHGTDANQLRRAAELQRVRAGWDPGRETGDTL